MVTYFFIGIISYIYEVFAYFNKVSNGEATTNPLVAVISMIIGLLIIPLWPLYWIYIFYAMFVALLQQVSE